MCGDDVPCRIKQSRVTVVINSAYNGAQSGKSENEVEIEGSNEKFNSVP